MKPECVQNKRDNDQASTQQNQYERADTSSAVMDCMLPGDDSIRSFHVIVYSGILKKNAQRSLVESLLGTGGLENVYSSWSSRLSSTTLLLMSFDCCGDL